MQIDRTCSIQHIFGNVLMSIVLGIPLELVHRFYRIGPLFISGVVLGALVQYAFNPQNPVVGSSAGVYALIVAHMANVVLVSFCISADFNDKQNRTGARCPFAGCVSFG